MDISKPKRDMDELIRRAQDKTALIVWGDASFISGLEQLTAALNTQAQLSQIGRIVVAYHNLLDHLCVRLRLIHYHAERPAVAEQQIRRPLFILGLPRAYSRDKRIVRVDRLLRLLEKMTPGFRTIHDIGAHLAYLKCLLGHYPDASIILTHRRLGTHS